MITFEQFCAERFNELNGPLFVWDMLTDADKERWRVELSSGWNWYRLKFCRQDD